MFLTLTRYPADIQRWILVNRHISHGGGVEFWSRWRTIVLQGMVQVKCHGWLNWMMKLIEVDSQQVGDSMNTLLVF